ncbi:hypothetical protein [Actinacidiphila yeochonensis]|uniref:hypothetical protein n=1 Tax=Actinacidiphila yeochonensis TaxID=89050 RepID=UPI000A4E535C|nr:hypothetical protein [Actinacidiphila yeochonensis]
MGPLPSTIYWRRRAVLLCLLALAIAVVAWVVVSGGGKGGGSPAGASADSHTPAASITPGPTPTGPHISGAPGGRDTAPADSSGGSGSTAADGGTSDGSSTGSSDGSGSGAGSGSTGSPADGGSSSTGAPAGQEVPAGSSLPDCAPGSVTIALASVQNSYGPGEAPEFRLTASNTAETACKVDFGPRSAVLTVSEAPGSSHVWASDDCPATGSHLLEVPAHSAIAYTVRWNAKTSSPKCAAPKGKTAAPGTYLVQARMAGYGTKQTSFQISED